MSRIRMALVGMVLKVAAPVAATLAAALVFGSLPKANVPATHPVVQLTSGGKFAARIPDAGPSPQQDGFEVQTIVPTTAEAAQLPGTDDTAGEAGKASAMVDMGIRPRFRLPLRSEARRLIEGTPNPLKQSLTSSDGTALLSHIVP